MKIKSKTKEPHALICWDFPQLRDNLATFLRMNGLTVAQTGEGTEGVAFLEKSPTKLLIIGWPLRTLSPVEVLYLARSRFNEKELLVLLISQGQPTEDEKETYKDLKVDKVCIKADYLDIVKGLMLMLPNLDKEK